MLESDLHGLRNKTKPTPKLLVTDDIENDMKQLYIGPDTVVGIVREMLGQNDVLSQIMVSEVFHEDTPGLTALEGDLAVKSKFSGLTWIEIPASVKSIGSGVFRGCHLLRSVILHEGLEEIGKESFQDCRSLQEIRIPSSVRQIKEFAFNQCLNLQKVEICGTEGSIDWQKVVAEHPIGLLEIERGAFSLCSSLQVINIPMSVQRLRRSAFLNCCSLRTIKLPSSVKEIPSLAFKGCSALEDVSFEGEGLQTVGQEAFSGCALEHIDIQSTVTSIGPSCFAHCLYLKRIKLPSSLTKIPAGAFYDCSSLKDVSFEAEGLRSIGLRAFSGCAFDCMNIPSTVTELGKGCFANCINLRTIKLPSSVTQIPAGAFHGCSSLKDVSFEEEGLQIIGDEAFFGCAFENMIVPSTVFHIGEGCFANCLNLRTIKLPPSVTEIPEGAFLGCPYLEKGFLQFLCQKYPRMVADVPDSNFD